MIKVKRLLSELKFLSSSTPGSTDMEAHHIRTGGNNPVRAPAYRIPVAYTAHVRQELKAMTDLGADPSNIAWSAPIVCIKKSDGKSRMSRLQKAQFSD